MLEDQITIFISYSSADKQLAECLHSDLEKNGHKIWRYVVNRSPGDWETAIRSAIKEHEAFLALMSKSAYQSSNCKGEWRLASSLQESHNKLIIPILIDVEFDDLPIYFGTPQGYDFRDHDDPESYNRQIQSLLDGLKQYIKKRNDEELRKLQKLKNLVQMNCYEDAGKLIQTIVIEAFRVKALCEFGISCNSTGKAELACKSVREAEDFARCIDDETTKRTSLGIISQAYFKIGYSEESERLQNEISPSPTANETDSHEQEKPSTKGQPENKSETRSVEPQQVQRIEPQETARGKYRPKPPRRVFFDNLLSYTPRPHTLLYFEEWDSLPSLHTYLEFQTDPNREIFQETFAKLEMVNDVNGIRLLGRPGTGKTRLVLETIRNLGLEESTIYAANPFSIPDNLFTCIALADLKPITLVVDNSTHHDLRALLDGISSCRDKVRFITIESIAGDIPRNSVFPIHVLEPIGHNERNRIIQQIYDLYGTSPFMDDKASYHEEFIGENLNLLVTFINALLENPQIQGLAALSNTEKLSELLSAHIPIEHHDLRTLQGLALSNGIGLYRTVRQEAEITAEFMGLSYAEFKQSAETLRKQGLIIDTEWYRHDIFHRFVVPRLFAVHLAVQVWQARGDDILEKLLMSEDETERSLRSGILSRLGDLGHREIALPVVRYFLNRFETFEDLALNPDLFRLLGEAEPFLVVNHLSRIMRDISLERLLEFRDERRSIIFLLTSLLRLEETFWPAARLVGRFAAAENENYGNNATGIWRDIFCIRSGTNPINGLERLRLIEEFLNNDEPEMRRVAINGIESVLNNFESGHVTRGPGGYLTPSTWRPETWREFWDIRRAALPYLEKAMKDPIGEVAAVANQCLLQYARHQIPPLLDEILEQLRSLAQVPEYRLTVWKNLQEILNFEEQRLSEEQAAKIQSLADTIVTDSYHDQLVSYVADFDVFQRGPRREHEETEKLLDQKLEELAKKGYENENLLTVELDWLISLKPWPPCQIYSFTRKLGQLDQNHRWFTELTSRIDNRVQLRILEAYMRGRADAGQTEWVTEELNRWARTEMKLAPIVLTMPDLTSENDEFAVIIESLLDKEWIGLTDLLDPRLEKYCAELLSTDAIASLIGQISQGQHPESIYVGTAFLFQRLHDHPEELLQFSSIALNLLAGSAGEYASEGLYNWYREQLETLYVGEYPIEIARIVLQKFKQSDGYIFSFMRDHDPVFKLLDQAIQHNPQVALDILDRTLPEESDPEHISEYRFSGLDINLRVNSEILINWAEQHQPRGPQVLAEMCFVGNVPLEETVRELMIRHPDDEFVWNTLARKFTELEMMEVSQIPIKLKELRDVAVEWLEDEHPHVRQWAQDIIDELDRRLLEP